MPGTARGALVSTARRLGISPVDYAHHIVSDEKWCVGCKAFQPIDDFGQDKSRGDGRSTICPIARARRHHARYVRKGRSLRGWLAPARAGDKLQARRRVNYLVERGRLAHPNTRACTDCGHDYQPGERRHEYDHFKGYAAEHQLDVEPVCSRCHHRREDGRR